MVDKIKTVFRMFKAYGKIDLLWFLRDTKYCILYMFSDLICSLANIVTLLLLASKFEGFGGMSQDEMVFMMSYSILVDGVFMLMFMGNNISQISRVIGRGQLDHRKIQPVPHWIQFLTEGFSPLSGNINLILGVIMMVYSMDRLELDLTLTWIFQLIFYVIGSVVVIMSMIYIVSCQAFYTPVESEEIAGYVLEFTKVKVYPLGIYTSFWKTIFCTILPVGMAAWIPALLLLQIDTGLRFGQSPLFFVTIVTVAIVLTTIIFRRGMDYYTTNGSPRYSGFGHR